MWQSLLIYAVHWIVNATKILFNENEKKKNMNWTHEKIYCIKILERSQTGINVNVINHSVFKMKNVNEKIKKNTIQQQRPRQPQQQQMAQRTLLRRTSLSVCERERRALHWICDQMPFFSLVGRSRQFAHTSNEWRHKAKTCYTQIGFALEIKKMMFAFIFIFRFELRMVWKMRQIACDAVIIELSLNERERE